MTDWQSRYQQFKAQYFDASDVYQTLVKDGQHPKSLVIACSDSRVDPAILLKAEPGDLFVVRNVANLIPPASLKHTNASVLSAIEYGLLHLHIPHLLLIGHRYCGGIQHLMTADPAHPTDSYIDDWMFAATDVRKAVEAKAPFDTPDAKQQCSEQQGVLWSYQNLLTYPWIKALIDEGKLTVDLCYFDLSSGALSRYNTEQDAFVAL